MDFTVCDHLLVFYLKLQSESVFCRRKKPCTGITLKQIVEENLQIIFLQKVSSKVADIY